LGDPLERDPESVTKDIRRNLVTREAAEEEYGVVLNDGCGVDTEKTEIRRDGLRAERPEELPQFDHGPLPSLDEQRKEVAETRTRVDEWLASELG
jgi:N-methylhydantoinase B